MTGSLTNRLDLTGEIKSALKHTDVGGGAGGNINYCTRAIPDNFKTCPPFPRSSHQVTANPKVGIPTCDATLRDVTLHPIPA